MYLSNIKKIALSAIFTLLLASSPLSASSLVTYDFEGMKHFSAADRCARTEGAHRLPDHKIRQQAQGELQVLSATKVAKAADAGEPTTIDGDWIFTFGDYYYGDHSIGSYKVNYKAKRSGSFVFFEDPTQREFAISADYNEAAGELTFMRTALGVGATSSGMPVFLYQSPYIFDVATNEFDYQTITAQFDSEAGTLTFAPRSGIDWIYYLDVDGKDFYTYGFTADLEKAVKDLPYVDNPEDWADMGKALLMDGWVLPGLDIDQTDPANQFEVPLQRNKTNENLYRLVSPYHYGPAARYNQCADNGYIMFDVTDPEHVLINPQHVDAGFAYTGLDIKKFYCYNALVSYAAYSGLTTEEVIEQYEGKMPFTTFKDGMVTLSYIENGANGFEYDATFGDQDDRDGGYAWTDEDKNPVNMSAAIYFPGAYNGIEEIVGDDKAESPVYFNLSGIRVEKPGSGLYIVKQGSKVSKALLK